MSAEVNVPAEAIGAGWHEFRYPRPAVDEPSEAFKRGLAAAAPLIEAAVLIQQADELYAEAKRLIENVAGLEPHEEFTRGFAHGVLVKQAKRLEACAAELRGESQ